MIQNRTCLAVILAAGMGTRMKSARAKVMHEIAGLPLLGHVLKTAQAVSDARAVVLGPDMAEAEALAKTLDPEASVHIQAERRGTAHAVLSVDGGVLSRFETVLVLYGDTPLIEAATLTRLKDALDSGADLAVLGFEALDPTSYGRLIVADGRLAAIREEAEANAEEKAVSFCNSGVMALKGRHLPGLLEAIGNGNKKGEYFLTDAVALAFEKGLAAAAIEGEETEFLGVNDRSQLAEAEFLYQTRRRADAMAGGVTLQDPDTVYFAYDTELGADSVIEPHVHFGPGVKLGGSVTVKGFSHIEGAEIGDGAVIGPFARLRPGTRLSEKTKVGNFVELKNAAVGQGAKVNHLSYVGDAKVGANANIGAGTITCNYDGFDKFETVIGADAFVGSNTSLVAPVTIGEGAYVGSGSVITKTVTEGALAVARGRQIEKTGWAERLRQRKPQEKKGNER